jgi:uncharacterized protein
MTDLQTFVTLGIVLAVGTFVQSAAGFAAGLLVVSVLVWIGYPVPEAQIALLIATIPQNIWGVWAFRDAIRPRTMLWPVVGRLSFLPIGIATLYQMENLPPERIKQVVGGVLLAITLTILLFRVRPREALHPVWSWLAFPVSGFLQGLVGMGGPAMVLWVQAHDWDTRRSRGFLFAMYLTSLFPALAMILWTFGRRVGPAAVMATVLIPVLLAITSVGLRAGTWLGRKRLRRLTIGLLIFVATMSLLSPFLARLPPP